MQEEDTLPHAFHSSDGSTKMANVRDSDTSLWLHNKLGTSNDSWISGSICSQLNKEVLRNIKECFPDLQTQVKLKLLLSFFHIPRRAVEEWKTELEEIIEVAGLDSELWVSMIAETMKTFPASGSLNTEISDYEETRPIFTDMVNDLKKLVSKHSDLGMLPLECQYLNKNALVSVVGQQPNPVKHFTLKRKPKSTNLRTELLQKSADAQSSLKKSSAPTIPLRSRGMPRKMTDTTPLKGIPSRVPTSGFRSPITPQNTTRPNMSRTPAGRKDGGIKLIEFTEQPLGYAAAKKRKRQQELEEQQKRSLESKQQASTAQPVSSTTAITTPSTTPDYAAGLTSSTVYTQPSTPLVPNIKDENISKVSTVVTTSSVNSASPLSSPVASNSSEQLSILKSVRTDVDSKQDYEVKVKDETMPETLPSSPPSVTLTTLSSVDISSSSASTPSNHKITVPIINSSTPVLLSSAINKSGLVSNSQQTQTQTSNIRTIPISSLSQATGPVIISQTIIQPKMERNQSGIPANVIVSSHPIIATSSPSVQATSSIQQPTQIFLTSSPTSVPPLTTLAQPRQTPTIIQSQQQNTPTKILLKTAPTMPVMMSTSRTTATQSNPPPLISTQPTAFLNIQNLPNRPVTIQPASQAAQAQHIQAQLQQQQQQQQQQNVQAHTVVSNTNQTQQPKFAQVVVSPNVKGKTIILAPKGMFLKNVGGDVYQQIPLGNVPGLSNLGGATLVTTGPPGLVKTSSAQTVVQQPTQQNIQAVSKMNSQKIPALIPTNNLTQNVNVPMVIASHNVQQPQQTQSVQTILGNPSQQTIIRPVLTNVQGNLASLPQGLTLIQRPGQQPQLVQVQTNQQHPQQLQMQRTVISQPSQTQIRPQQIIIQHKPHIVTTQQTHQVQLQQQQPPSQQQSQMQNQAQQPQRKGLSLSNEHVIKAHEMFRKANRVSRPDKALILGFMAGLRENPRPNPENVIVIKLGETEEKVKQDDGSYALMLVESHIRLDYNTGEWKTFQNYRRLDQNSQNQQQQPSSDSKLNQAQAQNSVVI